ncbi:MAG TPA: carboxypeptidase-like regulatory domain-containing protein [Terriglobia bacterium]|nr:carboxypeptidase-like regulatory domain-containing protein [Terriglobia bacterium]
MRRYALGGMFLCLFCSAAAWAQDTATIVGTVTDPTGAVMPGVRVAVSNPDKGYSRELLTDTAGAYVAAKVPIGSYAITAEATGFQRTAVEGVVLTVGQTQRVDIQMRVGSTSQQVTVTGNVAKVETENGTISDVVTGSQVTQLNLNGRSFTNLAILVPGAAALYYDPTSVGVLASSGIAFNGVPVQYNSWEIDGTNNTDQGAGGTANMVYPSVDSIAEFRITTSTYNAESSKNAGATIEVATKAGTNKFHGDMFEFVRNDKLDANDWFANREIAPPGGNAPKTPLKRNNYGFTLGGPVLIPNHYNSDKTKTFFFWSEEWRQFRQGTVIGASVPTTLMRQGDFSECDPAMTSSYNPVVASNCTVPINPATGAKFTNDAVLIDPRAAAMLSALVPVPNNGVDGYVNAQSLPTYFRDDQIRVDQNLGTKTSIFVRYTQDAYDQTYTPTLWSPAVYDTVDTLWTSPSKSAVIHLTNTFRPNLTNEFIMGFSADVNTVNEVPGASSPAHSINKPSGWSAPTLFPANAQNPRIPGLTVSGTAGPASFMESSGFNYFYWGPVTVWKDNAVWIKGKHMLKFGFYLQDTHLNQTTYEGGSPAQGIFTFSNSGPYTSGNALADMYLGEINTYQEYGRVLNGQLLGGYGLGHWREWDLEPYFQDDWRATSRLTLNLGVRYYLPTPYHDVLNPSLDSIFLPDRFNPAAEAQLDINGNLIPGTGQNYLTYGNGLLPCGSGGIPTGCMTLFRGSVVPRIGFAWDPTGTGKTSLRGGYGISYDVSNGNEGAAGFFGNPPGVAAPAVYYINGYDNIEKGVSPVPPTSMINVAPHQTMPSVQQFSLGVQHEFPANNLLSASYVGSLGRHLQRARNMDQVPVGAGTENVPALAGTTDCDAAGNCNVQQILINNLDPPIYFVPYRGYSSISDREWAGSSSYSSLQLDYRHKLGHGVTVQAAYTWSHTIDNLSSDGVNDYDFARFKATSGINQAQILMMNYVYQVPFFAHSAHAFARTALGGWEVSGITGFQAGQPIDFPCGIAGLSSGVGGAVRCNSLGPVKIQKGVTDDPQFGPTPTWFNPNMIGQINLDQLPANGEPGMFGYMGRDFLTGPGRNNWDIALLKNFALPWFGAERSSIQFRWETFNTFNHPQWSGVNASCGGGTPPGTPCSGITNNLGNAEVASAFPPRIMQFGLKFIF